MLKIRGVCNAFPREPFTMLSENEINLMKKELDKVGILEELK